MRGVVSDEASEGRASDWTAGAGAGGAAAAAAARAGGHMRARKRAAAAMEVAAATEAILMTGAREFDDDLEEQDARREVHGFGEEEQGKGLRSGGEERRGLEKRGRWKGWRWAVRQRGSMVRCPKGRRRGRMGRNEKAKNPTRDKEDPLNERGIFTRKSYATIWEPLHRQIFRS